MLKIATENNCKQLSIMIKQASIFTLWVRTLTCIAGLRSRSPGFAIRWIFLTPVFGRDSLHQLLIQHHVTKIRCVFKELVRVSNYCDIVTIAVYLHHIWKSKTFRHRHIFKLSIAREIGSLWIQVAKNLKLFDFSKSSGF